MIYKQCILTINGNNAKLDEDIYLFRLDKNIELYFTIVNNKYKFNKSDLNNIINLTNASCFQMRLYKNAEVKYTFAIQPTDNEKAILTITDDLIDEPIEVGDYDFQISLLDADKSSMISLPIVSKQIHVCEPLVTDASETGTAVLGLSTLESGEIVDAFDEEGNYIRKVHVNGELISAELFNKWEEALETNSSNIKTLDSQFKEIANLKNSTNVVDLKKYNITQADYTTPFTVENYNVAYQNGLGFQQAIDDAKEKNIQELIIPPGNYPLCYHANSKDEYNTIINSDGIDIIANDCKFYVIYDEEGINPYYSWTEDELTSNNNIKESYRLSGSIFNTNRDIIGAEIVGERVYRKNANTKYMDKSYGIGLTTYTKGNKIKNCKIHHISGDGIGCGKYMQQVATWLEGADVLATAKKFDYSSKTFVDSTLSFTSPRHSIYWADITKPFLIRGKNYFIWSIHPLKIHCFGGTKSGNTYTEGEYLSTILVNQGEYFYFPKDTCFFYVEIVDSAEHEISATNTISMALGYGTYCDTVIEGCEIYANQRGGISNIPTGTIIKIVLLDVMVVNMKIWMPITMEHNLE